MAAMTPTKIALLVVTGLVLVSTGTCASCYLPRTDKVNITGTEVKRLDVGSALRDVRYIQTQRVPDKTAEVFRNEDTRFGWPPYFKFDAVDLAGEAARIAKNEPKAVVLITYYGYKSNVLGLSPNVVSMKVVEPTYEHVPIFNVAASALTLILILFVAFKLWRWLSRREAKATTASAQN